MKNPISDVVEQIIKMVDVEKIILFSKKIDLNGEISSFKICIITHGNDVYEYEKKIYIDVESEIPFDIVLYSSENWNKYLSEEGSFCNKVISSGSVIYG